jgi:A/G-specific adenine glycosylase
MRSLPGVGAYTARAIGSLAFGWPVGAVDTNVRRWLVRRFALQPDAPGSALAIQYLADSLAALAEGSDDAAAWTHASMELGAVVCRAAEPRCESCPVATGCPARGDAPRVPVARQSPFRGSPRAYRGAVLRALASAPGRSLSGDDLPMALAGAAAAGALGDAVDPRLVRQAVDDLAREGLAHRDGDLVRLGPPAVRRVQPAGRLQSPG